MKTNWVSSQSNSRQGQVFSYSSKQKALHKNVMVASWKSLPLSKAVESNRKIRETKPFWVINLLQEKGNIYWIARLREMTSIALMNLLLRRKVQCWVNLKKKKLWYRASTESIVKTRENKRLTRWSRPRYSRLRNTIVTYTNLRNKKCQLWESKMIS